MKPPLVLEIEDSPQALFLRIARAIVRDIERGRLIPGTTLPGARSLAAELGVHRNTVVAAYHELALQGWITLARAKGAVVARDLPDPAGPAQVLAVAPDVPAGVPDSPRFLFSDGTPDPRLVPRVQLARAFRRALTSTAFLNPTSYGDPRGTLRLRAALAAHLSDSRGLGVAADDILLTRGSQMALFLAARAIAGPRVAIAVENPGYPLAWAAFRAAGARVVGVPVDREGLRVDALADLARADPDIRAVLVTPHHQYPTTTTLGAGRRIALLQLAAQNGWTVIEDDYDHEYRYEGRPILPLAAAPAANGVRVIYVGSLSKMLAPGIRMGYAVAAPAMLDTMRAAREAIDRQGDVPLEQAIAELLEDGELQRHARKARKVYHQRRDTLVAELRHELGSALEFDVPAGGLAIWARVDPRLDAARWAEAALERGLAISPGARFAQGDAAPNAFRFGFAALDGDELRAAVRRLASARPG